MFLSRDVIDGRQKKRIYLGGIARKSMFEALISSKSVSSINKGEQGEILRG